jgi:aspartate beta-hydroxylase
LFILQTKVVLLQEITHEVPAVGETNAILQALLPVALSGTLEIRVGNETRTLEEGKMAVADYSFEHEMWYTGTDYAVLLMIQFWHPNLSKAKRSQLDILV